MADEVLNGWGEWSRHVLAELERLDRSVKEVDACGRRLEAELASLRAEVRVKSGVWGLLGGAIPVIIALLVKYLSARPGG